MIIDWIRIAAIIAAFQQHFTSRSIRFIFEDDTNNFITYNLSWIFRHIQNATDTSVSITKIEQLTKKPAADRQLAILLLKLTTIERNFSQVLTQRSQHSTKWLIFTDPSMDVYSIFRNIYVPFNVELLIIHMNNEDNKTINANLPIKISEIYKVNNESALRVKEFGEWTSKTGLKLFHESSLFARRDNLEGITLTVTTVENYPIVSLDDPERPKIIKGGFFGCVWGILEESLNFSSRFIVPPDGAWGVKNHRGEWTGMIAQLMRGEADVGLAEFSMTKERLDVMDFAVPMFYSGYAIVVRHSYADFVHWLGFLKPFKPEVWFALGATVLFLPIPMFLILYVAKIRGAKHAELEDARDIYLDVFRTLCQQGRDTRSSFIPFRITYTCLYYAALIFLALYSAALISFLTVQSDVPPFKGLRGFADEGTYKLGVPSNSGEWDMFSTSKNDLLKEIYTKYMDKEETLPHSSVDGLKKTCDVHKYCFFMASVVAIALESKIGCDVDLLPSSIWTSLSLGFRKHSPYLGVINHQLRLLRDTGILKRIQMMEWPKKTIRLPPAWTDVKWTGIVPILVMLSVASLIAIFILLLERHVAYILIKIKKFRKKYSL